MLLSRAKNSYYWVFHIPNLRFNIVGLGPLLQAKEVVLPLFLAIRAALGDKLDKLWE